MAELGLPNVERDSLAGEEAEHRPEGPGRVGTLDDRPRSAGLGRALAWFDHVSSGIEHTDLTQENVDADVVSEA